MFHKVMEQGYFILIRLWSGGASAPWLDCRGKVVGLSSYLVQVPQTALGHLCPQSGGTLHHLILPLTLVEASHQMLGASRPLMEWQASGSSGHEGEDNACCYLVFSLVKGGLSGKIFIDADRPHNLSWESIVVVTFICIVDIILSEMISSHI